MKNISGPEDINVFDYHLGMVHQWLTVMWIRCAPQIRGNPLYEYESLLLLRKWKRLNILLIMLALVALGLSDCIIFPILNVADPSLIIVCSFFHIAAVAMMITSLPDKSSEQQLSIHKDVQLFIFDLLSVCKVLRIPFKDGTGVGEDITSKTEHILKELACEHLYNLARIQNCFMRGGDDGLHEQARIKMIYARRVFQNFGIPVWTIDDYLLDPRGAATRIVGSPYDLARSLGLVEWGKDPQSPEQVIVQH